MITEKEIIDFIENEYWKSNLQSDSDIFETLGICGDDCFELIIKYSEKYNVDISNYLWYFHHEEEASWNSLGRMFYKTPNELVNRIPVTSSMLTKFANSKTWDNIYPNHEIPIKRKDIIINRNFKTIVLLIVLLGFLIIRIYKII